MANKINKYFSFGFPIYLHLILKHIIHARIQSTHKHTNANDRFYHGHLVIRYNRYVTLHIELDRKCSGITFDDWPLHLFSSIWASQTMDGGTQNNLEKS